VAGFGSESVAGFLLELVAGFVGIRTLHDKSQDCYAKVIKYADAPIEKVEIPFADEPTYDASSFPGLLHLPAGEGPWPCVIFLPGTDMYTLFTR
jgi:hypothetical protein